jgi:hypothetical protein
MRDASYRNAVLTVAATALLVVVATGAVFGPPAGPELYGALVVWPLPAALLWAVGVNPHRLSRFVVVFCGSLVGLSLLLGGLAGYRMLSAALTNGQPYGLGLTVNPVMAVLVGGALVVAYYAVFEWDRREDRQTSRESPQE